MWVIDKNNDFRKGLKSKQPKANRRKLSEITIQRNTGKADNQE